MRILIFDWLLVTFIIFGFSYFVDRIHKEQTIRWSGRFVWCSIVSAVVLAFIVFLERL